MICRTIALLCCCLIVACGTEQEAEAPATGQAGAGGTGASGAGGAGGGGVGGNGGSGGGVQLSGPGETFITYVNSQPNGKIAVRVQLPAQPRYPEGAPVVVVASTWFVPKYSADIAPFHLQHYPTEVGAIFIAHLWPGKEDPDTGAKSEGTYDFGGPDSLAALRDTIRFATGDITNVEGKTIDELLAFTPLTDNVGLYASSHAGVVATNVLAQHGAELTGVKYYVGRENPTRDEMYALELGHFDDQRNKIFNPFYDASAYTPTTISINFATLGWLINNDYPDGMPYFVVSTGDDYVLSGKGPEMMGKRYFSRALTTALADNGVFTGTGWPDDLAKPIDTDGFWPSRITVNNYGLIGQHLSQLKVMLVFAQQDHVQAAPDKPHIRQAWDGFHETASLWTRLNADQSYFLQIDSSLTSFPEHAANLEPDDWNYADDWGYPAQYATQLYSKGGSYAGMAEMADRVRAANWTDDLTSVLHDYVPATD